MPQQQAEREKLRNLSALPAKDILKNKARVCPPLSAVCEIVDNIFDNYLENGPDHDLSISFSIKSGVDGQIVVTENSGGVREEKLEPLVRLGVPYHSRPGSIGTWGEGLKVAAFSLGDEVEIVTHFPGQRPVAIHFENGWLNSSDWNVPVYSAESESISVGSTEFRVRHTRTRIDWVAIMRELSVIYGHKIQSLVEDGRKVHLNFELDGKETSIPPRPLASPEVLRKRMAFTPDFAPRQFTTTWNAENGLVKCRLIIALSPRHSGDTSGVYMFGNGRLFARALRNSLVGYGASGNAVLRDHPSCWRIHAYAFFDADNGADIPWQAPLKDGVSENHLITARFREMFRLAVAPYARFAKVAKVSELLPFTEEWFSLPNQQRAEIIYGKDAPQAEQLFKALPLQIRAFQPPKGELQVVRVDKSAGEEFLHKLDSHAKYVRQVISKRNEGGPVLENDVLRALAPKAFVNEPVPKASSAHKRAPVMSTTKVTVEVSFETLDELKLKFHRTMYSDAIVDAISFALSGTPEKRSGHSSAQRRSL